MSGKYRDYYALVDIDDFSPLAHFSFLGGKTPYFPKKSRSLNERLSSSRTLPVLWKKGFVPLEVFPSLEERNFPSRRLSFSLEEGLFVSRSLSLLSQNWVFYSRQIPRQVQTFAFWLSRLEYCFDLIIIATKFKLRLLTFQKVYSRLIWLDITRLTGREAKNLYKKVLQAASSFCSEPRNWQHVFKLLLKVRLWIDFKILNLTGYKSADRNREPKIYIRKSLQAASSFCSKPRNWQHVFKRRPKNTPNISKSFFQIVISSSPDSQSIWNLIY